jgi:hypothetical protein
MTLASLGINDPHLTFDGGGRAEANGWMAAADADLRAQPSTVYSYHTQQGKAPRGFLCGLAVGSWHLRCSNI